MQIQDNMSARHADNKTRRTKGRKIVAYASVFSMLVTQFSATAAHAALADVPLYLGGGVEQNVMFVLDDSGSMHWEAMPDDVVFAYYLYPRPNNLYGGADYQNLVADFNSSNRYNAQMRSPTVNKLYYNPAVTYKPWVDEKNQSYGNASITCTPHKPKGVAPDCRVLTTDQTVNMTGSSYWLGSGGWYQGNHTFYPAVYYRHNSGSTTIAANYTRVEIRSTTASYTGDGRASRTDAGCSNGTCTYDAEIQNFANWYTYYRSRILAARAGIGRAFASQGNNLRVGFGAINSWNKTVDGVSNTNTIDRGVRSFSGNDRTEFFNKLYGYPIPTSGTPLRRALDDVGKYYSRTDNSGPWGDTPGTNTGTPATHLQCRQSYTILMSDGYWNGDPASTSNARQNVDGNPGPTHNKPAGSKAPTSYAYSAVPPFSDVYANTLADVAMYYWNNDLRSDLSNEVKTNTLDPAFWQHMTTFGVGLGVQGSISETAAFNAISTGATINWPNPTTSNAALLDDMLHAAVNGRGGFFSAADPDRFASELSGVLKNIVNRTSSFSSVAVNSTKISANGSTHLYAASFNTGDWSGEVKAIQVNADGSVGADVWTASSVLPQHGTRKIKTWNGSNGIDFNGALGPLTSDQVDYLRGDATKESKNGGAFRDRSSKLGDVISASPVYSKDEDFGYYLLSGSEGSSYATYYSGKSSRTAVVYAAANDGMVHAFRAGDGVELFAYVPGVLWSGLGQLTSPNYAHKHFVDATPTIADVYSGTGWRTVLTGGLGAGGKAVYMLNVSNPDNFTDSDVMWEYTGNNAAERDNLGHITGQVMVARFADGKYWAVFGNGYDSTSGKAALYMVRADDPSQVKMFDLGGGPNNGLAAPLLVDADGDFIVDLIYAGDRNGNMWKFNVVGNNTGNWGPAYGLSPLFQAKDATGNVQPITSAPDIGFAPTGMPALMVYFGTGKYQELGDPANKNIQSFYGVVDSQGIAVSSGGIITGTRASLQKQTIHSEVVSNGETYRVLTDNPVDYLTQKGWVIDLKSPSLGAQGERVIVQPLLIPRTGLVFFQTIVPSSSPCDFGGKSWPIIADSATGGPPKHTVFDANGDGSYDASDKFTSSSGGKANASGMSLTMSAGFSPLMSFAPGNKSGGGGGGGGGGTPTQGFSGNAAGTIDTTTLNLPPNKTRASWRQIQ